MKVRPHKKCAFDSKYPSAFKRRVHVDWLVFDPDVLAAEVPVDSNGFIEGAAIESCLARHAAGLEDAFVGWCGIHAVPGPGRVYRTDWAEFLAGLRRARGLAVRNELEVAGDGGVSASDET